MKISGNQQHFQSIASSSRSIFGGWVAFVIAVACVLMVAGLGPQNESLAAGHLAPAGGPSFSWAAQAPPSTIELGESFDLYFRVSNPSYNSDHGGISVSFPDLTRSGAGSTSYSSTQGYVRTDEYTTGLSNVSYFERGDNIWNSDDQQQSADHLLVESDDSSWPTTAYRFLQLEVTPKQTGRFRVYYRFWICGDGYSDCARAPTGRDIYGLDQQGWAAGAFNIQVEEPEQENHPPSVTAVSPLQSLTIDDGESVTFRARATDEDDNISQVDWYVNRSWESGQSLSQTGRIERSYTHRFSSAGNHRIEVEFSDTDGESDSVVWELYVIAAPSIESLGCSDSRVEVGETVSCQPSLSGGNPTSYLWGSIGGNPWNSTSRTFSTSWDSPGQKTIVFEACNGGGCDSGEHSVVVDPSPLNPPVVNSLGCSDTQVVVGETVSCRPNLSGGNPAEYLWGSIGGSPWNGTSRSFSTQWDSPGQKQIVFEACNNDGCDIGEYWVEVVQRVDPAPRIDGLDCSSASVKTGEVVSCRVRLAGGSPSRYQWRAQGGSPTSGNALSFSAYWDSPGTKEISLEVCNDGGCDFSQQVVVVEREIPATLRVTAAGPIIPGSSITVAGSGFQSLSSVDYVRIGGRTVQQQARPFTDGDGQFLVRLTVPQLQQGSYDLIAEVYGKVARTSIRIEAAPPPEPDLDASPNSYDFGTLTQGSTPEAKFRVTNDGSGTLQWEVSNWPDWVDILEPLYSGVTGDATVRIRVSSDASPGRKTGRITFNSNGGDDPISLSANIVAPPEPDLDASPNSYDFGTLTQGSTPEARFRVTNDGSGTLRWEASNWPDWVDILEPLYSGVTGDATVRIRVSSDASPGRKTGRITFNSNGGDDPISLSANIVAPPEPDLDASPNSYDFGTLTQGGTPEARFRVTNDGSGTLRWEVSNWPDWVDILEPLYSGVTGDATVRIRVSSDASPGRKTGRINFDSNGGDDPISLSANIIAPPEPELDASPNHYNFGMVTRGSTPTASFRISNSGEGLLQWSVASWPYWITMLEPVESNVFGAGRIRVQMIDTAITGDHNGSISVWSNGGTQSIAISAEIQPTESLRLEPPQELRVVLSANESIKVSWTPANVAIEGYKLYVTGTGSPRRWIQLMDGNQSEAWVRNLVPGTAYEFSIAAFHGDRQSANSDSVTAVTAPRRTRTSEVIIQSNRVAEVYWDDANMGKINQPVGQIGPRYQFRIHSATEGFHEIRLLDRARTRAHTSVTRTRVVTPGLRAIVEVPTTGPIVLNFPDPQDSVIDPSEHRYLPPYNVSASKMVGNEVLIGWSVSRDAPVARFSVEQRAPGTEEWTNIKIVPGSNRAATVKADESGAILDYRVTAVYENSRVSSYPVRAAATLFVLADGTSADLEKATLNLAEKLRQKPGLESPVVREADLRFGAGGLNPADYNLVVVGNPGSNSRLISLVTEVFESAGGSAFLDQQGSVNFAERAIDCDGVAVQPDAGVFVAHHPLNPYLSAIVIVGNEIQVEEVVRSSGIISGLWDWGKDTVLGLAIILQVLFSAPTPIHVSEDGEVSRLPQQPYPAREFLAERIPGILTAEEVDEQREALRQIATYLWENPKEAGSLLGAFTEPYTLAWSCGDYGYAIAYGVPEFVTFFIGGAYAKTGKVAASLRSIKISEPLASTLARSGKYGPPLEELVTLVKEVGSEADITGLTRTIRSSAASKAGKTLDEQAKAALDAAEDFVKTKKLREYERNLKTIQNQMANVGQGYRSLSFDDAAKILRKRAQAGNSQKSAGNLQERTDKINSIIKVASAAGPGSAGLRSEIRLAAALIEEGWDVVEIRYQMVRGGIAQGEIDVLVRQGGRYIGIETKTSFSVGTESLRKSRDLLIDDLRYKNPDNDVIFVAVTQSDNVGVINALKNERFSFARIDPPTGGP